MSATLFPEIERTDPSIKRAAETEYEFLERVKDPVFDRVRDVLNAWFDRFDQLQGAEAASDLMGRLKSKQSAQFFSAFWELYLHESHIRLGFDVEVHPLSARGTQPDFVVTKGAHRHYLEAVMPSPGVSAPQEPGSVPTVTEYISEAFHPDYRLTLRFVAAGPTMPRKRKIISAVKSWLDSLNWEQFWSEDPQLIRHPETELRLDGWVLGLRAIPMRPEARGTPGSMIWIYRAQSGFPVAVARAIQPRLEEKGNKYGDLDAPHVIAIWVMDVMASEDTIPEALFGLPLPTGDGCHKIRFADSVSREDAFWSPNRANGGRVSAVLATHSFVFNYNAVSRTFPRLWINPWADRKLSSELPYARSAVSGDETTIENFPATTSPDRLFGLPSDWPGIPFR
jgi:hypothetical protein